MRTRVEQHTDLDNHADQSVISPELALVTQDFNTSISVSGYSRSTGNRTFQTVTGVVAWDDPKDGKPYYVTLSV